ncbi:DNA replication and repair protein RecF [bioreactor metagenome]|uniref:DNA replication and repair protein RecF n=1 Tax=bioreactor metagenome TaxID=1076179 RepID=A0A645AFN8_9ZZZZ
MYIKYLNLMNFRNYKELNLEFCNGTNVFVGDNAQGKTNILEALYYTSIGKSHRTNKDKELISWNEDEAYISTYISKDRLDKKIQIKIFKEGKKGININSIKITKLQELVGVLNVVMFSPEDLNIVKDSPSYRRRFIDIELCKLNSRYYYSLSMYKKVLNERNTVLKKYNSNPDMLDIYDIQLSDLGSYIVKERLRYITKLNEHGSRIHKEITQNKEVIEFKYNTSLKLIEDIKGEIYNSLVNNRKRDIERRVTSVGPHRDDVTILINNMDVKVYGSQGQQRTSVLSIKFASLYIIKELTGEFPLLLLDDVLSELDTKRQEYILSSIKNVQTLITCTGMNDIKSSLKSEVFKIFKVKNGHIEEG